MTRNLQPLSIRSRNGDLNSLGPNTVFRSKPTTKSFSFFLLPAPWIIDKLDGQFSLPTMTSKSRFVHDTSIAKRPELALYRGDKIYDQLSWFRTLAVPPRHVNFFDRHCKLLRFAINQLGRTRKFIRKRVRTNGHFNIKYTHIHTCGVSYHPSENSHGCHNLEQLPILILLLFFEISESYS